MSIIIDGMKMPKDGECVVIFPGGVVQKYKAGGIAFYEYQDRTEEAVAVQLPPHGRLVDADALIADTSFFDGGDWHYGYSAKQIENAPTIIPAEEE